MTALPFHLLPFRAPFALTLALVAGQAGAQSSGNLLANGSFESGSVGGAQEPYRGGGWAVRGEPAGSAPLAARASALDIRAYRDTQTPAGVGIASLRLALLPGRAFQVVSPPVSLVAGRSYAASLFLRADTPGTSVSVKLGDLTETFSTGPRWERFAFTAVARASGAQSVIIQAQNAEPDARPVTVWLDGVQLEAGARASGVYRPAFPFEMRAICDRPGHVFFDGEKIVLDALIAVSTPADVPAPGARPPAPPRGVLRIQLLDTAGAGTTLSRDVELTGNAQTVRVSLPDVDKRRPRGVFKARFQWFRANGEPLCAPADCVYARLPRPRSLDPVRSGFGVCFPLSPAFARIALATGNRWARGVAGGPFGWPATEWEPGRMEFFDTGAEALNRSGMAVLATLGGLPPWARGRAPLAPAWRRYVGAVADHYKTGVTAWEVRDLGEARVTAPAYGELLPIAGEEIHRADGDAFVAGYQGGDGANVRAFTQDVSDDAPRLPSAPGRPAWNVESRIPVKSLYAGDLTDANAQAARLVRFEIRQRVAGVEKCFLCAEDRSAQDGLLEADRAVSVVLAARAVLASFTDGAGTPTPREFALGIDGCTFPPQAPGTLPDDKTSLTVVWSRDAIGHVVPLARGTQARDLWGNDLHARGSLTVGPAPVYLLAP